LWRWSASILYDDQTSPEGQPLVVNPALARILGYDSPEEVVSAITDSANQEWVDPDLRAEYSRQIEEKEVVRGFECQFFRKDKTKIWVSLNCHAVRGPDGQMLYLAGFIEDITDRKQLEMELRQRLREIEDLKDRLEAESAYLQEEIKLDHNFANIIGRSDAI
jgi:PAS domain S-box-containing protein